MADLLVESGAIPRVRMQALLSGDGDPPVDDVIAAELLTLLSEHEDAAAEVLAEQTQMPALVFGTSTIDLTTLDKVPASFLREQQVLPLFADADAVTVAVGDPLATAQALEHMGIQMGRRIVAVSTAPALLTVAIERAVEARAAGDTVLRGARTVDATVVLTLARPPVKVRLPRADSVARALADVFKDSLENLPAALRAPAGPTLGTLRLKKIRNPASADMDAGVVERPFVVHDQPHVLVVEDDEAIGHLLCRSLGADGYETRHILSGDAVAEALRSRRPDLIVLDAMLPGVHGFEICAALKKSPEWRSTPVVMVSAVYRGFDRAREIQEQHGADAFVEKPFQLEHVRRVVADLLRQPLPVTTTTTQKLTEARARALVDHHVTMGDADGAARVVDRWLSAEPLSARAWLERGHLAIQADDHVTALRAYEVAAVYDRTMFGAQVSLAMLYEQLGFSRRARATWMAAAVCAPDQDTAQRIRLALKG
jgi:DNA-binding response OmpR family regulator